ncbi:hypothetical protein [Peredibacter starrii]|uniref:Uncharacterized protein n=1 Tax=Peredibacter starrii TaxID=28202 RepID=A0AAX4HRN5_9BACT|nr:hypothetical protein [Peredibacter starrii]WPU66025.1 hypothetical protein SOO65_04635 [Peredibacter starrii]
MFDLWGNILIEIGLFTLFGVLYYFYQKRKIMHYEANKGPIVMEMILQSCLSEKNDTAQPELDNVIEALDDYLQNKSDTPPTALLNQFAQSGSCSVELKNVIVEGLEEYGKK